MRLAPILFAILAFGCKDAPPEDSEAPLPDEDNDGFDTSEDCDDDDASINPDADELCDGVDRNCDGVADLGAIDAFTYYLDSDNDGYGDPNTPQRACTQPDHFVAVNTDCNDRNNLVYPGAQEVCDDDDLDEDCDSTADDADTSVDVTTMGVFYTDADGDGFGEGEGVAACDGNANLAEEDGDCDDSVGSVNPDATEVCGNGADDDCDGTANACNPNGSLSLGSYSHLVGGAGDLLGSSMAGGVDLSGDGVADWVVGANQQSANGAGYVKVIGSNTASPHATLTGAAVASETGSAVAVAEDGGVAYLAIGAPGQGGDNGAVYLLSGTVSSRTLSGAELSGTGQAELGSAVLAIDYLATGDVAACGYSSVNSELVCSFATADHESTQGTLAGLEIDGDGQPELALGQPGVDAGSVILSSAGGVDVVLVGGSDGDEFGGALSQPLDADGDGYDDLAVGAPARSGTSGGAYLYTGLPEAGYVYARNATASVSGGESGDRVGRSVALADVDGDGAGDLIVGAPGSDDAESDQGAVFVFYGPLSGALDVGAAHATLWGESSFAAAGTTLARAGDVNGDGYDDFAVGAPGESSGGSLGGAAYLVLGGDL